ncbi:MAG TPA: DUF2726 domain-containing protein [Chromobacteriaceae bacterium]|nr:DUF2726 domain-containing protein [Chromobacteriaceae bacterium]
MMRQGGIAFTIGQPNQAQVVNPQQTPPKSSFPPIFYLLGAFVLIAVVLSSVMGRQGNKRRGKRDFSSPSGLNKTQGTVRRTQEIGQDIEYFRSNDINQKVTDYGSARFTLKNTTLLTEREQGCYWRLVTALGPDFIVMGQVAFSQILTVKGGTGYQNHALFSTMRQKVADFVICRKDFTMIAVVELDDSSHANKRDKDKIRDRAIKEAGLLVFRLPSTPNHEPVERLADVLKRLDQLQTV